MAPPGVVGEPVSSLPRNVSKILLAPNVTNLSSFTWGSACLILQIYYFTLPKKSLNYIPTLVVQINVVKRRFRLLFSLVFVECMGGYSRYNAKVAELVDALALGASGATCESSSLSFRTKINLLKYI